MILTKDKVLELINNINEKLIKDEKLEETEKKFIFKIFTMIIEESK